MKRILVIGATSAIAEHCSRAWAARGDALYLVGRDSERLEAMAVDLSIRGATNVRLYCMDLNDLDDHTDMLDAAESALGTIDIVLIAHGTLSEQKKCEQDVALTMAEIKTNALSVIALLTLIANRFEKRLEGTIAVISSVAGDRGRASNYVYGSAKSMVTEFTSGLRQRLHKSNVAVLTIKPGYVDTPMTREFKKGLLWAKPSTVAAKIVKAIDGRRELVYVPTRWWMIMAAIKALPEKLFVRISL